MADTPKPDPNAKKSMDPDAILDAVQRIEITHLDNALTAATCALGEREPFLHRFRRYDDETLRRFIDAILVRKAQDEAVRKNRFQLRRAAGGEG